MKVKRVLTYQPGYRKFRVCRFAWRRIKGDPGYSRVLSISLWPRLFTYAREETGWVVTLFGVQIHLKTSGRGIYPD
jgi:hypothetical protein